MNNLTDCKNVNPTIIACPSTSYEKVGYKNVFPKPFEKSAFSPIGFFSEKFQNFFISHQLSEGKPLKQTKIGPVLYPRLKTHFPGKVWFSRFYELFKIGTFYPLFRHFVSFYFVSCLFTMFYALFYIHTYPPQNRLTCCYSVRYMDSEKV